MSSRPISDRLHACGPFHAPQGLVRAQVPQVRCSDRRLALRCAGAVASHALTFGGEEAQRVEAGHGREHRGCRSVAATYGPAALASLAARQSHGCRLAGAAAVADAGRDAGLSEATSVGPGEGFSPTHPAVRSWQPVTRRPGAISHNQERN